MVPVQPCDSLVCVCVLCSDWFLGSCVMFSLGAFDFKRRCHCLLSCIDIVTRCW